MPWGRTEQIDPFELFRKPGELESIKLLRVGVYGDPGVGKTHFALTFPEPVFVIDTEIGGAAKVAAKFRGKEIYVFNAVVIDPSSDEPDPVKSFEQLRRAVRAVAQIPDDRIRGGTIVIDSGTDVWDWIQVWMQEYVRKKHGREPFQFDYKYANEKYRNLIASLLAKPTHLVMTFHTKPEYDGPNPTGRKIGDWQKKTPYWMDFVVRIDKQATQKGYRYPAYLEKSRFVRVYGDYLCDDITFPKLVEILRTKYGLELFQDG